MEKHNVIGARQVLRQAGPQSVLVASPFLSRLPWSSSWKCLINRMEMTLVKSLHTAFLYLFVWKMNIVIFICSNIPGRLNKSPDQRNFPPGRQLCIYHKSSPPLLHQIVYRPCSYLFIFQLVIKNEVYCYSAYFASWFTKGVVCNMRRKKYICLRQYYQYKNLTFLVRYVWNCLIFGYL